ncbi:MAG: hypothetical protein M1573_00525 [Candidatus Parvarchaeota archaeon]|nr:hypothetical protein [Candidatus Parvarchaeota archaeon]
MISLSALWFNFLKSWRLEYILLVTIIILIFFKISYNLYRSKKTGQNLLKNKAEDEKNFKMSIKDKKQIKNETEANKYSDMKSRYIANLATKKLIPKILMIVSLIIMLTSLVMPALSILLFKIDIYQVYQTIFQGMVKNSYSLIISSQSYAVSLSSVILLMISLLLYILSIIEISLSFKNYKRAFLGGITSILYSVFLILGLNSISFSSPPSSIQLSFVGFGPYMGIIIGVIMIVGYYIEKDTG